MDLEAALVLELENAWQGMAPMEYLYDFNRQVEDDEFFECLLHDARTALLTLQNSVNKAENITRRAWLNELVQLKNGGDDRNIVRISILEGKLNELSENTLRDRVLNFCKTDIVNSEKMTPHFLRIAKTVDCSSLKKIRQDDGTPFENDVARNQHIVNFYQDLYSLPRGVPQDFTNCVENFLGNLTNHPVVRGCMLTEEEKVSLEDDISLEELDQAADSCNMQSAPGIDGVSNKFVRKFWNLFRVPLLNYTRCCAAKGQMTSTFNTALIRLIQRKATRG